MASEVPPSRSASWVLKYGPHKIESLLRTIVCHRVTSTESDRSATAAKDAASDQDLASFLLDREGHIVTWSPGAARIYLSASIRLWAHHVSRSITRTKTTAPSRSAS